MLFNKKKFLVIFLRVFSISYFIDFIHSNKKRLHTFSILVFINFIIMGLGFLTRVKLANMLGKHDFGLLAYGLALGTFGSVSVRFGMDRTLVRDLVHNRDRFEELVAGSVLLRGIILVFILSGILLWKILCLPSNDLSWAVLAIFMSTCIMSRSTCKLFMTYGIKWKGMPYIIWFTGASILQLSGWLLSCFQK